MDAARFAEFSAYDSDVFASFVADLWERAGYDCSLVDARVGGPNVVAHRRTGGVIRIATSRDTDVDATALVDAGGHPSVDVVVVPQSSAEVHVPPAVEVFDADRLAELVEELDATALVDDYLLGRSSARERTRHRRERRAAAESTTSGDRPGSSDDVRSTFSAGESASRAGGSTPGRGRNRRPADPSAPTVGESTGTAGTIDAEVLDLTRGRAFTLVVVGVIGLCLGTSIGESVGGVLAVLVLNGSYLCLLVGMIFDARSLDFTGFTGTRGLVLAALLGYLLLVGVVSPLWAALAGGLYLLQRLRVERAHTPDGDESPAWAPLGRHPWYWAVVVGTVGWSVAALGAASPGGLDAGTVLVGLGSWLAVPFGLSYHGRRLERPPSRRLLALGAVPYLGAVAGLVYVARQERDTRETPPSDGEGDADAERRDAGVGRRLERQVGRLHTAVGTGVAALIGTIETRSGGEPTADSGTGIGREESGDDAQSTERQSAAATDGEQGRTTGAHSTAGVDDGRTPGSGTSHGRDERRWTAADLGPPVRRPPRESRTIRHDGVDFRCTSVASRNGRWRVAWGAATVDGETRQRVFLLQYEARQATVEAVSVSECAVGDDGTVAVAESDGDGVSRLRILASSGATVLDRGIEGEVRSVAVDSGGEGTLVGVGVRSPARVVVVDGRTGEERREVEVAAAPDTVEFREGAGDRWLVAGSETQPAPDAAVRVRDGELVQ